MEKNNIWVGDAAVDLVTLSYDEVAKKYGITRESARNARYRLKKQLKKEMRLTMEKEPGQLSPEEEGNGLLEQVGELIEKLQEAGIQIKTEDIPYIKAIKQYQVARGTEEDSWDVKTLYSVEMNPREQNPIKEVWPQATPAKITPTRRKPRNEDGKRILIFSDPQIGFRRIIDGRSGESEFVALHDESAIRLMQMIAADMQPDEIWNAGDTIDLAELSRFAPDSDHFFKTMGKSVQAVYEMYAQLRADNPNAKIVEVDSNHNDRYKQAVLKNFPQAYDMYRPGETSKYPMLSYPYMTNLEALEIEFVGGYGAAQYEYGLDYYEEIDGRMYPKPPVQLRHGTETSNNGSTAGKVHKNHPDVLSIQGHDHEAHMYMRLNRLGQRVGAVIVPPLCRSTGEVPSYHSAVNPTNEVVKYQEAWPTGVVEMVDHEGEYEINFIFFRNGLARYRKKLYDGRE